MSNTGTSLLQGKRKRNKEYVIAEPSRWTDGQTYRHTVSQTNRHTDRHTLLKEAYLKCAMFSALMHACHHI